MAQHILDNKTVLGQVFSLVIDRNCRHSSHLILQQIKELWCDFQNIFIKQYLENIRFNQKLYHLKIVPLKRKPYSNEAMNFMHKIVTVYRNVCLDRKKILMNSLWLLKMDVWFCWLFWWLALFSGIWVKNDSLTFHAS